jgi:Mor family transcriptional regulator
MSKYKVSSYRFYKILREYDIKPKKNKTGPKNTKFKQLLYGTEEEQKAAKIFPECFVVEDFVVDSKNGMKITDLMSKYNLTLYQIRELRKQNELNKTTLKK